MISGENWDEFQRNAVELMEHTIRESLDEAVLDFRTYQFAVEQWKQDYKHGVEHSFWVYEQAKKISDAEQSDVAEDDLFVRAVLHDFGDFLPDTLLQFSPLELANGIPLATAHAHKIAIFVEQYADIFGSKAESLAIDLYYHDHFWEHLTLKQISILKNLLSPAGQIMADADRLAVRSELADAYQHALSAVKDNRAYLLGKWYFYREDLTTQERRQWRFRTGGLYDSLAAILYEFFAPDYLFYTNTAKRIYLDKQTASKQAIVDFYSNVWEEDSRYMLSLDKSEVKFGLNDKMDGVFQFTPTPLEQLPENFSLMSLNEQIDQILVTPVLSKSKPDRDYFGYSLYVEKDNRWIDPSVVHFESLKKFQQAIITAVEDYEV